MLPSKISPTSSPRALMTGDPLLPPTMSLVVTKSNGVFRFSVARALAHDLRILVGRLHAVLVGADVEAAELRERFDLLAIVHVALHRAVRQPQGERRVGIRRLALRREHGLRDLGVGIALDGQHLVVVLLPQLTRARLDQARELDERIFRRAHRRRAAREERLPHRRVAERRRTSTSSSARASGVLPARICLTSA